MSTVLALATVLAVPFPQAVAAVLPATKGTYAGGVSLGAITLAEIAQAHARHSPARITPRASEQLPTPDGHVPAQSISPHSVPPAPPGPTSATIASSFAAVDDNLTSIPPDTHGAAGPAHLVTVHNGTVRVQDRAGATISTVTLDEFWSSLGSASRGQRRVFYSRVSNDGNATNRFTVKGTASPAGAIFKYFAGTTTTNITSAVVAGTYAVGLRPGAFLLIRIEITIRSSAGHRSVKSATLTTRFTGVTLRADAVRAKVTVL